MSDRVSERWTAPCSSRLCRRGFTRSICRVVGRQLSPIAFEGGGQRVVDLYDQSRTFVSHCERTARRAADGVVGRFVVPPSSISFWRRYGSTAATRGATETSRSGVSQMISSIFARSDGRFVAISREARRWEYRRKDGVSVRPNDSNAISER